MRLRLANRIVATLLTLLAAGRTTLAQTSAQTPVREGARETVGPAPLSAPCPDTEPECTPPEMPREFRGVWVATVGNMDWPSRPGLPTDSAKLELLRLLDAAQAMGLNAVIFQVRPAGDAMYASTLEPWSEYLTGRQGQAPIPAWDPLAFAVREAHRRGLGMQAWFNPYRAQDPTEKGPIAASHFSKRYPAYAKRYGAYTWFDPGEPAVRRHTVQVILDVVRRYDVDGIHLDDYFYPYPVQRGDADVPFPDGASYRKYRRAGGRLAVEDWRRDNVNRLVDTLRTEIAKAKPWVKFGISPFGIWRPGEPQTVTGFDAYARIFADARTWLRRGWVDYLVPQLYWGIEQEGQRFPDLLRWWLAQNDSSRAVWAGLAEYKIRSAAVPWRADEIIRQVINARATPGAGGAVHFSMNVLIEDHDSVATALGRGPYQRRALVPAMPWKGAGVPRTPEIALQDSDAGVVLTIARQPTDDARWWAVQVRTGGVWRLHVLDGGLSEVALSVLAPPPAPYAVPDTMPAAARDEAKPEIIALTPVGRTGAAGVPVAIRVR